MRRTVSVADVGVLLAPHDRVAVGIPRDLLPLPNLPRASRHNQKPKINPHSPNPKPIQAKRGGSAAEPERAEADGDGDVLLGGRLVVVGVQPRDEPRRRGALERRHHLRREPRRRRGRRRRRRARLLLLRALGRPPLPRGRARRHWREI